MKAPKAPVKNHRLECHNDLRIDPYYWLNERENPEVIQYLEEENAYTKSQLASTEKLQDKLFEEIKGRIKEDDESVPYHMDGYWYYSRFKKGGEYPLYCRKPESLEQKEELLLDGNGRAEGHDYYHTGGLSISHNQQLLAFGEDTVGRRIYTLRFKNLDTGELLEDVLENTTGSAAWAADHQTVFYTQKDPTTLRSYKIYKHKLGTAQDEDELVFHETDETFSCAVFTSKSKAFVFIGSWATVSSEYRFIPATQPDDEFKVVQPRERDHEYSVMHYEEHFYILTNWKARNFRLMKTGTDRTEKEHWQEVIAHRPDVLLEDVELFSQFLVLNERSNALNHIRVIPWDAPEKGYYLPFSEAAYVAQLSTNRDFKTTTLRYAYSSLTVPASVYDFNMVDQTQELKKQVEVVGGYEPSEYHAERLWAKGEDGTEVPISLVYRKDAFTHNGRNPLLLYGYGSYGHSIDPGFSSVRLSLLDRGFVYAIAHIRGGEELGRPWYENGKLLNKKNTFTDFIACAEHLVHQHYTQKEHLYAMGGSAGGLLIGAVINLRPELFHGAIAAVPFVDVVTTMLDDSIPLTTGEYDEWGNPNDEQFYHYIKSYSPYDQVKTQDYPHLLVTTGLHDSQVQYWEPAKWVARLRSLKTDQNLLLLHTNMTAGHGGASGRFSALKEVAMEYAFLFMLEGIRE